ncbi:CDP-alcohol phosphatidyltransferase family protein [Methylobrevis pamukkalensis]|uniref:CDP-alcohol phosphatidyltransferase n=1 Tax=Methylobrevis pamukkalensis TaxID=1439726 RepID=A0A1E3H3S7_9HYPH|nr:CDP-alcohol phosphatidyltransferase family protein [Methylobrevis pamukkalensis]ODN70979.1 CDP-alcohol phosphatidyltransferase [Methylobrevis pamukkalensis]
MTVEARSSNVGGAAGAIALAGAAVAAAAALLAGDPRFGTPFLFGAFGSFGLIAVLVLATVRRYHPFPAFGPANVITLLRAAGAAILVGLLVTAFAHGREAAALVSAGEAAFVAMAAALMVACDGLDGRLARARGLSSAFGARFDMEIDALTILCLSALAVVLGKAGLFAVGIGLLRYVFVAAGWLWPRLAAALPPSRRRQTICVVQYLALIVALLPFVPPPVSGAVLGGALLALLVSFGIDMRWLLAAPAGPDGKAGGR